MNAVADKKKGSPKSSTSKKRVRNQRPERIIVELTREEAEFHNAISLASARAAIHKA